MPPRRVNRFVRKAGGVPGQRGNRPIPPSPLIHGETSFFKPSTHEMQRVDSDVGYLTTQLDARRISRLQTALATER